MSMGAEIWLPVEGFSGIYEVSDLGRVRSLPRRIGMAHGATRSHEGRIMTPVIDKDGYPRVILRVDGRHYTRKVHRLVALAFHGDKRNALHREVDHGDGDRANARASNLRWVSRVENMSLRRCGDQRGEANPNAILTEAAVIEIRRSRGSRSANALAGQFGVTHYSIYDIWRGRRWRHVK